MTDPIALVASAAVIWLAALAVGAASLAVCGHRGTTWVAGPVGLAVLLAAAGLAVQLPGESTTAAVVLGGIVAAALVLLGRRVPLRPWRGFLGGLAVAAAAGAIAAIPFVVNARIGPLGVGLINDDMASHLVMTDWLMGGPGNEPALIEEGYPLGPHALVGALATAWGSGPIPVFGGLMLAIAALAAPVGFEALRGVSPPARVAASVVFALPYLIAAYLAQGAFKEPIIALFVVAFAIVLQRFKEPRQAVPLGLLAAGAVFVYSFPGLVWLALTAAVWLGVELARARWASGSGRPEVGRVAIGGVAALAAGLVLIAPELPRILEFRDFNAFDPEGEGVGLGNLGGHLSPLEALGVWPTSEFRLAAGAGSLPAIVFYAGAALAAAALALAIPRWIRRHGPAVPAALVAAIVVYVGARGFGTVYTSAKALAVAAPLVVLIAFGGLLHGARAERTGILRTVLGVALLAAAAGSSFLVLRQAPVGPTDHMDELAEIRPLVEDEKVLFLGRDNFVLYELRGSRPFTHVRNFYDPYFVRPNFELRDVGSKFDFDAVTGETLARFPYVVTTRAAYGSGPPPGYVAEHATDSYVLWRAAGSRSVRRRQPVERGATPTGRLACARLRGRGAEVAAVAVSSPVVGESWSAPTIENGESATARLRLRPGRWLLSLRYDATRRLTLTAPGLATRLPANLDYRGVAPFWPAGEIDVRRGGPVSITATVEEPALAGRLLDTSSVAHLEAIAATRARRGYSHHLPLPYPGAGERISRGPGCGREADWLLPAP